MFTSKVPTLIFALLITTLGGCQSGHSSVDHEGLKRELDSLASLDQKYRRPLIKLWQAGQGDSKEAKELGEKQMELDQSLLRHLQKMMDRLGGFPGSSIVGNDGAKTALFILQHGPDSIQAIYLPMIRDAAGKGEISKSDFALYLDRYLMHRNQPQVYGSQITSKRITHPQTGDTIDSLMLWPIQDTTNIDSIRLWNGLGPLEEYLNTWGLSRWR